MAYLLFAKDNGYPLLLISNLLLFLTNSFSVITLTNTVHKERFKLSYNRSNKFMPLNIRRSSSVYGFIGMSIKAFKSTTLSDSIRILDGS